MPFPQSVRDQALVDAARHCCVCHRYKGVKVEVHHIVSESQGGPNEVENAITLCFDCHADAGHYNPNHPRGTKFSPSELRRHRDNWHFIVRQHAIHSPDAPDLFYCRYLLCKSFDAFREITVGELSHVPAEQPFFVSNAVRDFQRAIVEHHPERYRHDHIWGDGFNSRESYSGAHPEVRLVERSSINLYPYFEAIRVPSREELRERVARQDGVTRLLVDTDVPAGEISVVLAYDDACGGRFQEIYRLRPLWALYLAATNVSDRPLTVGGIEGEVDTPTDLGYRPFAHRLAREGAECSLPAAPLPPGATLLAPIATLLGPVANISPVTLTETRAYLPSGQGQVIAHQDLGAAYEATSLIGPAIWPRSLRLRDTSTALRQQRIHEFDLSNLYTIGRFWEAGSCPHLFACATDTQLLRYLGELFARQASQSQSERVVVPAGTRTLVIAELERETTTIEEIRINGNRCKSQLHLEQGDVLRVKVQPGDVVELRGRYTTESKGAPDPWLRNCIVGEFMANTGSLGTPK